MASVAAVAVGCGGAGRRPSAGPRPPAAVEVETVEVRIAARRLVLQGTLSRPAGAAGRPAVVLVHGSGPLGRDERMPGQLGMTFGFEVPIFAELARDLSRAGFVVVRYDKRTCTPATGCDNDYPDDADASFDVIYEDAQAVLDWLRERPEVDASALFVVGHSLGGAFVPELMLDNPDLVAGVALAAPYRPIDELSAYQRDYGVRLLRHQDRHPLVIGVKVRELSEVAEGLAALRAGTLTERAVAGAPVEFWRAWMDLGDALPAVLERLDRPILVLSGAADTNVPPSETALWRRALERARPDPGHQVAVLPCVTHAMNCVTDERAGRHVAPAVRRRVVSFVRAAYAGASRIHRR